MVEGKTFFSPTFLGELLLKIPPRIKSFTCTRRELLFVDGGGCGGGGSVVVVVVVVLSLLFDVGCVLLLSFFFGFGSCFPRQLVLALNGFCKRWLF